MENLEFEIRFGLIKILFTFLVLVDRLGMVSVISSIYGPRVAFWNIGKGARLLSETVQMGINGQNYKSISPGNYQVAILTPEGDIRRVVVPLHLALSDQHSPRLGDLATLKELTKQLREDALTQEVIATLLQQLRLSNSLKQAVEKIVASEKFELPAIKVK